MHGEYYAVADSDPRRQTVVIASTSSFPFDRNDNLTFYAPDTQCWGTGVIDDLYSVNQPSVTSGKQNKALSANSNNQYNYDDCDFMQVRALGQKLVLSFGNICLCTRVAGLHFWHQHILM